MNELTIFDNEQFGKIRTTMMDGEPWFVVADVCAYFGVTNRNRIMQNVDTEDKGGTQMDTPGGMQTVTIVNESGLYSVLFALQPTKARGVSQERIEERQKKLRDFKRWITHDVIPTIRKTGGYVNNDELFISMYFDEVDEASKEVLRKNLAALRKKNEIIAQQRKEIESKDKEIEHKENVIVGLVEDIDLTTKRQRINQIIRFHAKTSESLFKKWNLLYSEFEKKYHVNLSIRLKNYKTEFKPQLKNKLDVIDRQMHMIPQLYEVCCKLFENDVKVLMEEWENAIIC